MRVACRPLAVLASRTGLICGQLDFLSLLSKQRSNGAVMVGGMHASILRFRHSAILPFRYSAISLFRCFSLPVSYIH